MIRTAALVVLIFLVGCSNRPNVALVPTVSDNRSPALDLLYQQFGAWRGTPYRLGGQSHTGIDCSAFVQNVLADGFGISLPRTTALQQHAGSPVPLSALKAGDLVFFKPDGKGRHVGIYLENGRFMHASTTAGVTISSLHTPWWRNAYWKSRRPAQFQ